MIDKEKYDSIFARDKYMCQCCGGHVQQYNTMQLAHRIRQGKQAEKHIMIYIWNNYKKDRSRAWVQKYIINNEMNLVSTCSLACNSHFNIFTKSIERDELIDRIITETRCLTDLPDK